MTTGDSSWMQLLGYGGAPIHQGSFVQENAPATEAITQALPEVEDVEDPDTSPELIVKGVKARYQLERPLGQGGSGSVHRAICLDPESGVPKWVALKTLVGLDDHISRLTLKRELSSLLAISSDRIPKVWDYALDGRQRFVVMEYFPMGSLNRILAKVGRLDIEQCWILFHDLLEALIAAHAASVLHLDIKPGNVLVGESGRFTLTDFGISQGAMLGASARMPTGVGTRGYQAPEQRWRATALYDMRTDLYGVGATMWAACTGVNLASQRASSLWAKTRDEPYGLPPLEDFLPFCPPEFSELVKSLLVQNPTARPGSAAEVLQRVQHASRGLSTPHALPGDPMTPHDRQMMAASLIDPVWSTVFSCEQAGQCLRFPPGTVIAQEGEQSYRTYILLQGKVGIYRGDDRVKTEDREGQFLGEIATLTGGVRTATMKAETEVVAHALNASQLEQLVTGNPAIGIRLLRTMANRLATQK